MIEFIFDNYSGTTLALPINPKDLKIPRKNKYEKAEILGEGEIISGGIDQLKEITITSFLPSSNKYPFIITKKGFKKPKTYIKFFNKAMDSKKPIRLTVTDMILDAVDVVVSNFTYSYVAQDDDIQFSLSLTEYKTYGVKKYDLVQQETTSPEIETQRISEETEITIGKKVTVNGQLFADSYGGGPGKTLTNYTGIITSIKKGRAKPYHISTINGGWLGWVAESSVINVSEDVTSISLEDGSGSTSGLSNNTNQVSATPTNNTTNNTKAGTSAKTNISSTWGTSSTTQDNLKKLESLGVKVNVPTSQSIADSVKDKFTPNVTYNNNASPGEYMKTDWWKQVNPLTYL